MFNPLRQHHRPPRIQFTPFARIRSTRSGQRLPPRPPLNPRAANNFCVIVNRLGPANEITLNLIAVFIRKEPKLLFRFDAFRHHRKIEPATKSNDCANDRRRLLAMIEIGNESLIDLDLVEWK